MKYNITVEPTAVHDLRLIYNFISQNDSSLKAKNFLNQLKEHIKTLEFMPYKHRKSYYHDNENIRDLIFKGYTIVFKIEEPTVHVLTIFRQRNY